jgi:hypothetical protein
LLSTYAASRVGNLSTPDYGKSVARVFSEAMADIIIQDFKLGYPVLPLHVHGRARIPDLPSWVPDLTCSHLWQSTKTSVQDDYRSSSYYPAKLCPTKIIENRFVSMYGIPAEIAFEKEYTELHTSGYVLGTIRHHCHLDFDSNAENAETPQSQFFSILNGFCEETHLLTVSELLHAILGPRNPHLLSFDDTFAVFVALLSAKEGVMKDVKLFRPDRYEDIWRTLYYCCPGRTLFGTDTGRFELSIGELRKGDIVAGLFGIGLFFILREVKEGMHQMINVTYIPK